MKTDNSLVSYYQEHHFNPVIISVENQRDWNTHFAKRRNLYENHLNIPLSLFRERSVIEFGCNSGENALVLGAMGAVLTLVEPNEQVLPRLNKLFELFKLENSIKALKQESIESFETDDKYDVVIAEGYLNILSTRENMVEKICNLLVPGGIGIISFDDKYGSLIELTKRAILWKACQIQGIGDIHSGQSLAIAKDLFMADFEKIHASRDFESWWKDQLVNPYFCLPYLWSYQEIIPLIEKDGCAFYSSSPGWNQVDHFQWYKNVISVRDRHAKLLETWKNNLPYFLMGKCFSSSEVSDEVMRSLDNFIHGICDYTASYPSTAPYPSYPIALDGFFKSQDKLTKEASNCLRLIFEILPYCKYEELFSLYRQSDSLRHLWGTPYHYVSFIKQ